MNNPFREHPARQSQLDDQILALGRRIHDLQIKNSSHTSDEEPQEPAIRELQLQICTLKSQRNELCFIHQLPHDNLVLIFEYSFPYSKGIAWVIKLRHVCRHWQTVVDNYPLLWQEMDCGNREVLKLALTRSQSVPLSLLVGKGMLNSSKGDTRETMAEIIRPHTDRIRSFKGYIQSFSMGYGTSSNHSFPFFDGKTIFQQLEVLAAQTEDLSQYSGLLNFAGPRLRLFKANSCQHTWAPPAPPASLTSLYILGPRITTSVQNFLSILCCLPRLTNLKLYNCFNASDEPSQPGDNAEKQLVHLPSLQRINIRDKANAIIVLLLRRLVLPPQDCIVLESEMGSNDPERTREIYNMLLSGIKAAYVHGRAPEDLQSESPKVLILKPWRSFSGHITVLFPRASLSPISNADDNECCTYNCPDHAAYSLLKITIRGELFSSNLSLSFLSHWSYANLNILRLSGEIEGPQRLQKLDSLCKDWLTTFGDLVSLQEMALKGDFVRLLQYYIQQEKLQIWGKIGDETLWNTDLSGDHTDILLDSPSREDKDTRSQAEQRAWDMGLKFCALRKLLLDYDTWDEQLDNFQDFTNFLMLKANLAIGIEHLSLQGVVVDTVLRCVENFVGVAEVS